ncbi:hypothetical protein [Spirosoma luteum]|uniref:hypothetical protein n=1 Tax=Spirosoma luteum TaxID=431553 RepID=UPI000477010F|nr:hypothetical protein [Spirosoma luteum]
MKQLFLTTLSLVLMTGFLGTQTSCSRAATPAHYTGNQLMLGSGGGVTGFATTYYLLANGKLFSRSSRDTVFTFIGRQTRANTKRVFEMAEQDCAIKTTNFNHPGNTYKFAQWKKGEESYRVTWGDISETVPASYPRLYTSFMTMLPISETLH